MSACTADFTSPRFSTRKLPERKRIPLWGEVWTLLERTNAGPRSPSRKENRRGSADSKRMKCEDEIGASRAILRLTKDDLILPWLSSNLGCQSPREKIHKFC
jgi:hypothetical protein